MYKITSKYFLIEINYKFIVQKIQNKRKVRKKLRDEFLSNGKNTFIKRNDIIVMTRHGYKMSKKSAKCIKKCKGQKHFFKDFRARETEWLY